MNTALQTISSTDQLPASAPAEGVVMMSFEVWRGLKTHPRQRDTERHAKAKHFMEARTSTGVVLDRLNHVTAAVWNGEWYKVDGHTRTHLWEAGELPKPQDDTLRVTVYECKTRDELNHLYMTFDSPSAAERSFEQIYGAMRELGVTLNSKRLRRGHFKDALFMGIRGLPASRQPPKAADVDLYKATAFFKDELLMLDQASPRGLDPSVFLTGILAAALITTKLWPETIELWAQLNDGQWRRTSSGQSDAPGILTQEIMKARGNERVTRSSRWQEQLFGMALMAAKKWHEGHEKGETHWFRVAPRRLDPVPLIEQMRKEAGKGLEPTLFIDPELISERLAAAKSE